jgi:hypothetical protein
VPSNYTTPAKLRPPAERKFAELLARLNLEIPRDRTRPVAQRQRLAEDIMGSFIDVAGEQLVKLLSGEQEVTVPLDRLEVLVSLYYTAIKDVYFGTDSHLPSRFRQVHPFLLDYLAESTAPTPGARDGQDHTECYVHHRVRIIPHTVDTLNKDRYRVKTETKPKSTSNNTKGATCFCSR